MSESDGFSGPRGAMLLVVTEDLEFVLHHRDDLPEIAHPGRWAGFGGAVEEGESVEQALRREVLEEIGVGLRDPIFLADAVDDEGDGRLVSLFFVIGEIKATDIELHEGLGIGVFTVSQLENLDITPFVRRTIKSHLLPTLFPSRY